MKIKQILTNRSFSNGKDYRIVNEWEDMLSQLLDVPLYYDDWKRRDKTIILEVPVARIIFPDQYPDICICDVTYCKPTWKQ